MKSKFVETSRNVGRGCLWIAVFWLGCGEMAPTDFVPGPSGPGAGQGSGQGTGQGTGSSSEQGTGQGGGQVPSGDPLPNPDPNSDLTPGGRWTGVNWFGFETGNMAPHGLWSRDYKSMLKQIFDLGFNSVRLPWCNAMLEKSPTGLQINEYGVDAYTKQKGLNVDLAGLTSIQVMDKIIQEAQRLGLLIILDNHSREPDGYMNETLWYTAKYSEEKWIEDWKFMANRYKNYPNVVAADLNNEPHGNTGQGMKPPASWGADIPGFGNNDWKKAAEKCGAEILEVAPHWVIVVEGVEQYKGETYWWGGNLAGVRDNPITGISKDRLMYSPHEYGPEVFAQQWFSDPSFPDNMPAIWDKAFWFIHKENSGRLFFGEFGIKESSAADKSSVAHKWLRRFMEYVGKKSSWTFWCMNANSGDTGGILQDDWVTVNPAKYGIIKPYLEPIP